MECSGNHSGVLQPTPLKCSHYTLMGVDTGIRSPCMHRNLMIQHKLILINYTTTVDDFYFYFFVYIFINKCTDIYISHIDVHFTITHELAQNYPSLQASPLL